MHIRVVAAAMIAAWTMVSGAMAQSAGEFPQRQVKVIVPFTPGGSPDLVARAVAQKLQDYWNVPVVVENRSGAGGAIGTDAVAKSPPDGYTILAAPNNTLIFNPLLSDAPYDPVKDFAPVSMGISVPNIMVASPDLQANSIAELIALAKSKPGELSYGTGGPGSPQDLSMRLFLKMTGVDITPINYRGTTQVLPDLMTNRVHLLIAPSAALLTLIEEKKIKLMAGTGTQRYASMPQTPAIAETVPGYSVDIWTGFVMPAGTPDDIIKKANAAVVRALAEPDVRQTLTKQGMEPYPTTPEQMRDIIKADLARWGGIIDASMKQKK